MKQMPIRVLLCLLALCLCIPFAGCAGEEKEKIPDGMQIASVEGDPFRLYVPTSWNVGSFTGVAGAYYTSAKTSAVTVKRVDSDAETTDAFFDECTTEYRATFGERFRLDATDVSTFGGEDAKVWTFTAWTPEDDNYKVLECAVRHDGAFYLFTYAASPDLYDMLYEDVQEMIRNFCFTEPYVPEKTLKVLADAEAPEGMKIASTDLVPYRFFVPENWTVNMKDVGTSAYFSEEDRSNVSVTAYVPDADVVKLGEYFDMCWAEYKDTFSDLTLLSRTTENVTMGGRVAEVWEFTASVGGETYHYRQTVITYNSLFSSAFYTLTYTATEENYSAHLSDVDAMVQAFTLR